MTSPKKSSVSSFSKRKGKGDQHFSQNPKKNQSSFRSPSKFSKSDKSFRSHKGKNGSNCFPKRNNQKTIDPTQAQAIEVKKFLYQTKEPPKPLASDSDFPLDNISLDTPSLSEKNHETTSPTQEAISQKDPDSLNLVSEKSPWKEKQLNEDSLMHLLLLEILYVHGYGSQNDLKKTHSFFDSTFIWIRENNFFSLKQKIPVKLKASTKARMKEISRQRNQMIAEISPFLIDWGWERLSLLKQNILITAWYLIKHFPEKVTLWLNDAINHAKWFGEEKDYAFVNSILDKLITDHGLWKNQTRKDETLPTKGI